MCSFLDWTVINVLVAQLETIYSSKILIIMNMKVIYFLMMQLRKMKTMNKCRISLFNSYSELLIEQLRASISVFSLDFYSFSSFVFENIRAIHQCPMKIPPPYKTPTPYGGRLTWILPGGNFLIAHIKDKTKIRHKKRWSQVS